MSNMIKINETIGNTNVRKTILKIGNLEIPVYRKRDLIDLVREYSKGKRSKITKEEMLEIFSNKTCMYQKYNSIGKLGEQSFYISEQFFIDDKNLRSVLVKTRKESKNAYIDYIIDLDDKEAGKKFYQELDNFAKILKKEKIFNIANYQQFNDFIKKINIIEIE